jgi:hypothetical protein
MLAALMPERHLAAAKYAAETEALARATHAKSVKARKHAVCDALEAGVTIQVLADALGVSTERIRQLAGRPGADRWASQ